MQFCSTREGLGSPTQTRCRGFNFYSKIRTKLDSGEGESGLDPLHLNEAYALKAKISLEGTSGILEFPSHGHL